MNHTEIDNNNSCLMVNWFWSPYEEKNTSYAGQKNYNPPAQCQCPSISKFLQGTVW